MHNGTCVKETECPCVYQDKFYKQGDSIAIPGVHCAHMYCTIKGMKRVVDHDCRTPVTCKDGRVFQHCPCERTCNDDAHHCDKSNCVPACACTDGHVWNGEKCVAPKQCTCAEGNVTYTDGHSWEVGQCSKCHCVQGRKQCAELCAITEEDCKKEGKKLFNKDLKDGVCCRCVSEEAHCVHNGEEKPIGAVWHKGLCETYTCTKTPQDTGMITVTKTSCPVCAAGEQKEYVANKCCPVCRKTTPSDTTPKTKPPQKCGEVVEDHDDFVDLRVNLQPDNKGEPSDLRPITGKGWAVLESDKPSITIVLSTNDDTRPGQLEKLSFIGNVKSVLIQYTTVPEGAAEEYKPYNNGQPINVESGEVVLTRGDDKTGLVAFKVQVTGIQAVKSDLPLNLKLKAYACVDDVPEPCNQWVLDEFTCSNVLSTPGEFDNSRITLQPAGNVADLSGKGWNVSPTEQPVITLNVASADGKKPGLLEKMVLGGNVKTVKVEYSLVRADGSESSGFHDYQNGEEITLKNGLLVFTNEVTKKTGILVSDVRITVTSAIDETQNYNINVQAFACVQDHSKEISKSEYDSLLQLEKQLQARRS
jgi:hypothetical protein